MVRGLFGDRRLRIVDVVWHGSAAITLTYTDELTGRPGQELLYRDDAPRLSIEQAGRAWSMDGDAHHFRLASEAKRISLAYLFDPFRAVQSSKLDPLPIRSTRSTTGCCRSSRCDSSWPMTPGPGRRLWRAAVQRTDDPG